MNFLFLKQILANCVEIDKIDSAEAFAGLVLENVGVELIKLGITAGKLFSVRVENNVFGVSPVVV